MPPLVRTAVFVLSTRSHRVLVTNWVKEIDWRDANSCQEDVSRKVKGSNPGGGEVFFM